MVMKVGSDKKLNKLHIKMSSFPFFIRYYQDSPFKEAEMGEA